MVSVELRDLSWAIVASQHRSLRQAAATLNIRQSTLSRALRDLEFRVGTVLFERTNGGTRLTVAGEDFIEAARHIVSDADAAFSRLKDHGRGAHGRLALGVCMALSVGNLRATLMEHQRCYPEVDIISMDGARKRLLSDLSVGAVDVVLMAAGRAKWGDRSLPLWSERVIVAMPEGHPLSAMPIIRWADLAGESFMMTHRDPGPDFEHLLLSKLGGRQHCTILENRVALDRLLSLVGAGLGLTLVSEGATGAAYAGVTYRELHDGEEPVRIHFAAYWREANRNPTLGPFLDLLRERYPDLSPLPVGD